MNKFLTLTILFFSCINLSFAVSDNHKNVIFITIDGVRHQDVFDQQNKKFPFFWKHYAHLAEIAGGPTMETAPVPISMPSYLSLMTGHIQPCLDNDCPRVNVETLVDKIAKTHHLSFDKLAVFANWRAIEKAVSAHSDVAYVNTGNQIALPPNSKVADKVMEKINQQQQVYQPFWDKGDRVDLYTYQHAKHYLQQYKPRFLWISLGDVDENAHENRRTGYINALKRSDFFIHDLLRTLEKMPDYAKNTTIIVTTDHGRGNGKNWIDHGAEYPESKQSFLFVIDGRAILNKKPGPEKYLTQSNYTTLSIRPLIESVMGVSV